MTDTGSFSQLQTVSVALQGLLMGVILVVLSTINFHLLGIKFGLSFLPIAALLFWPKNASWNWSLLFVFVIGLLQATFSFTPLGLWAFCYLLLFIVMGSELSVGKTLSSAIGAYIGCVLFVAIILYFLGRLVIGEWPAIMPLTADAIASILVFPVVFWFRNLIRAFGTETEKREII